MARTLRVSYKPHNVEIQTVLKVFISDDKSPVVWKGTPDFEVRGVTFRVDGKITRVTVQKDGENEPEVELEQSH
jgi:hypothetical protein